MCSDITHQPSRTTDSVAASTAQPNSARSTTRRGGYGGLARSLIPAEVVAESASHSARGTGYWRDAHPSYAPLPSLKTVNYGLSDDEHEDSREVNPKHTTPAHAGQRGVYVNQDAQLPPAIFIPPLALLPGYDRTMVALERGDFIDRNETPAPVEHTARPAVSRFRACD